MIRPTQFFSSASKSAQGMRNDYERAHGSVWTRYNRPSHTKIHIWNTLCNIYNECAGVHEVKIKGKKHNLQYRQDLKIAGASSHFFSTIASFEDIDTGKIYLIKETQSNTYMCEL